MGRKIVYPVPLCEEEALFYQALRVAPPRPRNKLEKNARSEFTGRWNQGRPINQFSRTHIATERTKQLVDEEGMTLRAASRQAADENGLSSADNLRRGVRKINSSGMIRLNRKRVIGDVFSGLSSPMVVPKIVGLIDATTGEIIQGTTDQDGFDEWRKYRDELFPGK